MRRRDGRAVECIRIDVTLKFEDADDFEPVGSIEAHAQRIGGRESLAVSLGDTTGDLHVYRHRQLRGLPRTPWWQRNEPMSYALNIAQSALAKAWWHRD